MLSTLALAMLAMLPIPIQPAPVGPPSSPRVVQANVKRWEYRVRVDGTVGWVFGWFDPAGNFFYWPQDQPRVAPAAPAPGGSVVDTAANFGVDLGSLDDDAPPGNLETNDPNFGRKFFGVDRELPGCEPAHEREVPVPDARPRPSSDHAGIPFEKFMIPGAILAAAVFLVLFGRRKAPR